MDEIILDIIMDENNEKINGILKKHIKDVKEMIKEEKYSKAIKNIKEIYYVLSVPFADRKDKEDNFKIRYELIDINRINNEKMILDIRKGCHLGWGFNFIINSIFGVEVGLITGFIVASCTSGEIQTINILNKQLTMADLYIYSSVIVLILGIIFAIFFKRKDKFLYIYEKALDELKDEIERYNEN